MEERILRILSIRLPLALLVMLLLLPAAAQSEVLPIASSVILNDNNISFSASFTLPPGTIQASLVFQTTGADFDNSTIEVNGTHVGIIPITGEGSGIWAEFREDISSHVSPGSNQLYIETGINGINYDDCRLSNIVVEYVVDNTPVVQITAAWDQDFYTCDDWAQMTVTVSCTGGSGSVELQASVWEYEFGPISNLGTAQFSIAAGESQDVDFSYYVETCYYTTPYSSAIEYSLNGQDQPWISGPQLLVTDIPAGTIEEVQASIQDCSHWSACIENVIGAIPGVGLATLADGWDGTQCRIEQYEAAGRTKQANLLRLASWMSPVSVGLGTFSSVTSFIGTGSKRFRKAAIIPTAIAVGVSCTAEAVDLIEGFDPGAKDATSQSFSSFLADSLAVVLVDQTYPFRDLLFVSSPCSLTVETGAAYTSVDSVGMTDVDITYLPTKQTHVCFIGPNPYAFGDTILDPTAEVVATLRNFEGSAFVSLLHWSDAGYWERRDWDTLTGVTGSIARLSLSENTHTFYFRVDDDGDGTTDRWVYPLQPSAVDDDQVARAPHLYSNVPNPFNPQTTIAFQAPIGATFDLAIFDVAGRRVRTLEAGQVATGNRQEVIWDGCDSGGRAVSSGIYFYRLQTDNFVQTKRMALVR